MQRFGGLLTERKSWTFDQNKDLADFDRLNKLKIQSFPSTYRGKKNSSILGTPVDFRSQHYD
jgi:hypothetical protein